MRCFETLDGDEARVIAVGGTGRIEPVYNLTIADFHTYFVGEEQLFVHNCILENKAQGIAGEAATRAKLGDSIAGEQVTFVTSKGSKSRADFVTTDKGVVETKTGNARLTQGQKDLSDDIKAGREVTPVGENAKKAGLETGRPTTMSSCHVDRC